MNALTDPRPWCFMVMITEDGDIGFSNFRKSCVEERLELAKRGILRIDGGEDVLRTTAEKIWTLLVEKHDKPIGFGPGERFVSWVGKLAERPRHEMVLTARDIFNLKIRELATNYPFHIYTADYSLEVKLESKKRDLSGIPPPIQISTRPRRITYMEGSPPPENAIEGEKSLKRSDSHRSIFSYSSFTSDTSFSSSLSQESVVSPRVVSPMNQGSTIDSDDEGVPALEQGETLVSDDELPSPVENSPALSPVPPAPPLPPQNSPILEFGMTITVDGWIK